MSPDESKKFSEDMNLILSYFSILDTIEIKGNKEGEDSSKTESDLRKDIHHTNKDYPLSSIHLEDNNIILPSVFENRKNNEDF